MSMEKISQDEMMLALVDATSLLRDVEAAFRSIDQSEADEIADVALTLARLFLMSLTRRTLHTYSTRSCQFKNTATTTRLVGWY